MIRIVELREVNERVLQGINNLLVQLSEYAVTLSTERLKNIIDNRNVHLFVMEEEEKVIGMITLATYITTFEQKWWIEDVIVDSAYRGRQLGRKLVEHVLIYLKDKEGALMLTSNPKRLAANSLYQSMHFERKETNVYRMKLKI
ncbi:MAG: GNAT family N-acetyltransferase [Phocaeicola sp.]|uniref:GNAT family N-acetyltransferase n=1 Tax=Phocaeicola sp. TaxID=2773926 RepID=UPI003F9FF821